MAILTPVMDASLATQTHVLAVAVAVILAPIQLLRTRRDVWHKRLGYVWVIAMAITALSSFWIHDIRHVGPFSAIHLLSMWVLYSLSHAVYAARRGDIAKHRQYMESIAVFALVGAGTFTFAPYRMMNQLFFPGQPQLGFYVALAVGAAFFAWYFGRRIAVRLRPQ